MGFLSGKTILILSPQAWGKMFISKHHYALELARRGNEVYFLNPPDTNKKALRKVIIEQSELDPRLHIIHHRLSFPYDIKFHFIGLFHKLMKSHLRKVMRNIGKPIDIVWSFDLGNLYPFNYFPERALKIFHPVDEPQNQTAIDSATGAQVMFSVTPEILEKYAAYGIPGYCIQHGVSEEFLQSAGNGRATQGIKVGFSGNLLRPDIDKDILMQIMEDNPAVSFECWGSFRNSDSNIGGSENGDSRSFVQKLQSLPNVKLHGVVPVSELAKSYRGVDAFLICYDVQKDQSKGTNYHKVLEFISTGKVIVSNNISSYANRPDLVQMVPDRDNNQALPGLFKKIITGLDEYNSEQKQAARLAYARDNTYRKQVERIERVLENRSAAS